MTIYSYQRLMTHRMHNMAMVWEGGAGAFGIKKHRNHAVNHNPNSCAPSPLRKNKQTNKQTFDCHMFQLKKTQSDTHFIIGKLAVKKFMMRFIMRWLAHGLSAHAQILRWTQYNYRICLFTWACPNLCAPLFLNRMNALRTWSISCYFCILWYASSAKCEITHKIVSIVSTGKRRPKC